MNQDRLNLATNIVNLLNTVIKFDLLPKSEIVDIHSMDTEYRQSTNVIMEKMHGELLVLCNDDKELSIKYITLAKCIIDENYEGCDIYKKHIELEEKFVELKDVLWKALFKLDPTPSHQKTPRSDL
jgi:hypothetical protein